jgi:nucleoside-diphosphate-sugar epimerase
MKKCLITGGAGFIGRWLARELSESGREVRVLDNLLNSTQKNLDGLECSFVRGDVRDRALLSEIFSGGMDVCFHLAAHVVVQDSIDHPADVYLCDVAGTLAVLEECRARGTRMVFVSSCMVYDAADANGSIGEGHAVKPASPYAAAKLSAEHLVMSYHFAYGLPCTVLRPFNTYGPFQKSTGEGGVISIFLKREIEGATLEIYGDGRQTRDFLYVEDCARFIARAGFSDAAVGRIINAGSGRDVSINELAGIICPDQSRIKHVPHIHPQSEIAKLCCDRRLAASLLGWAPEVGLEEGLAKTRLWLEEQRTAKKAPVHF